MKNNLINKITDKIVSYNRFKQVLSISALSFATTFLVIQLYSVISALNQSVNLFQVIYYLAKGNINTYDPFLFSIVGLGITALVISSLAVAILLILFKSTKEIYFNESLYNRNYRNNLIL